jgi:hypothetical protein
MRRSIDTSRRPRLGVWGLTLVLPVVGCATLQSRANDPFDTHGVPFTGATSAAEVHATHLLGAGTLSIALVPCGASRFVGYYGPSGLGGYYGTSRIVHRIDVRARAEPDAGTLHVRVTAPDGVAAHDQLIPVTATDTEGQTFDVRVDAGRVAPTGTWIVELRAEGACRAMRLALSMHTAPISGP